MSCTARWWSMETTSGWPATTIITWLVLGCIRTGKTIYDQREKHEKHSVSMQPRTKPPTDAASRHRNCLLGLNPTVRRTGSTVERLAHTYKKCRFWNHRNRPASMCTPWWFLPKKTHLPTNEWYRSLIGIWGPGMSGKRPTVVYKFTIFAPLRSRNFSQNHFSKCWNGHF